MAKAQNSLPPEETRYPGVSITVSEDGGYAKLKSSTDYDALGSLIF